MLKLIDINYFDLLNNLLCPHLFYEIKITKSIKYFYILKFTKQIPKLNLNYLSLKFKILESYVCILFISVSHINVILFAFEIFAFAPAARGRISDNQIDELINTIYYNLVNIIVNFINRYNWSKEKVITHDLKQIK